MFNRIAKTLEIGSEVATALQLGFDVSDITKRNLFLSYYDDIKTNINKFEELHFIIIDFSERLEEDQAVQEKCDEMYFEIKSIHRNLSKSNSSLISDSKDGTSHVKLPKISLPTFSGDIKQWPEFFDKYNNLIHNCPTLSNTERFHYLVSTLRDDAASVIRTFPVTGEHYRDAYEFLVARYQNERELAFACWRDILNVNLKLINGLDLRRSLDSIAENLCVLKRLNLPVDQWDFILIYHVLSKLDSKLRREFEQHLNSKKLFKFDELHSFLQLRCDALLRDAHFVEPSKSTTAIRDSAVKVNHYPSTPNRFYQNVNHTLLATESSDNLATTKPISLPNTPKFGYKCSFCGEAHNISQCIDFLNKTVPERMDVAFSKRWCFNCLKSSHHLKDCMSIFSCQKCRRKHHTLLHSEDARPASPSSTLIASERKIFSLSPPHTTVLLATALIQLKNSAGTFSLFRAIFDTGSQNNLITEEAAQRLQLLSSDTETYINGIGGAAAAVTGQVCCSVGVNDQSLFDLDFHVIHKVCEEQPSAPLNTVGWTQIQDLTLADPGFDKPGPIDILLGADVFAECLLNERIKGNSTNPSAFKSVFGWLLLGKTPIISHSHVTTQPIRDYKLTDLDQRFWELDTLSTAVPLPPAKQLCKLKRNAEYYRDLSRCYMLKLPNRVDPVRTQPGKIAMRSFDAIERHLSRDPELYRQYVKFTFDYLKTLHMSLATKATYGAIIFTIIADKLNNHNLQISLKALEAFYKKVSLPRLKLCTGFLVTLHAFTMLPVTAPYPVSLTVYLWSGSTVILAYFRNHSSRWATLVVYRVCHVRDLTSTEWWHPAVSTKNSADICSRVQLPQELLHSSSWWAGPQWLSQSNSSAVFHEPPLEVAETKRSLGGEASDIGLLTPDFGQLLQQFSSADSISIVACWLRLIINIRNLCNHASTSFITFGVRHSMSKYIGKCVQSEMFKNLPSQLTTGQFLLKSFRTLNPCIFGSAIIRVGGRTYHSVFKFSHNQSSPLACDSLLNTHHSIHRTYYNHIQFLFLQDFRILFSKQKLRRCLSQCIRCNRTRPLLLHPYISNLPPYRDNQIKPFSIVRVDFAELFRTKLGFHRRANLETAYLYQFVCLAIKALFIQIEVVLNSRPLCPMSSNPNDLSALPPNHILTLELLTAIPDVDIKAVKLYRLNWWYLIQLFNQHFWLRWNNEYLHTLNERAKWTETSNALQPTDMILIKNDIQTPVHWTLARVVQLHLGADGEVRQNC